MFNLVALCRCYFVLSWNPKNNGNSYFVGIVSKEDRLTIHSTSRQINVISEKWLFDIFFKFTFIYFTWSRCLLFEVNVFNLSLNSSCNKCN